MEWRCYAWAGGVVVLEFYLFLVVFPARCSPVSLQDFTLGSMLIPPSSRHLGISADSTFLNGTLIAQK
jgi:hypothetical protein